MKRPQRSDFHKPVRRPRTAIVYRFPRRLIVFNEDRAAQEQAEVIIRVLRGLCPVCHEKTLSIQAHHGNLTFTCGDCEAPHDYIEAKLMKRGLIDRPERPRKPTWRQLKYPNG